MDLLGQVLGRRYRGKLERLDAREGEEVRRAHPVWLRVGRLPEADVHDELLEDALRQLGAYVKPNRLKLIDLVERVGSACREGEEVIETESLSRGDVLDRGLLVVVALEVDVFGRARSSAKRKSSAKAPFSTQRSGATWTSRRRNSSKATRLRSRARLNPVLSASVFIRCSKAMRNAVAVSYLTT